MKKVSAILCADLHLRDTTPECRIDNFMEAQTRKYKFLSDLQKKHKCPVLVAGDVFNHWRPSPFLIGYAGDVLPDNIIATCGQHDLPAHSLVDIKKSGIYALAATGKIKLLSPDSGLMKYLPNEDNVVVCGFPWGVELKGTVEEPPFLKVALIHYGVFEEKPHYPGAERSGGTAQAILRRMKGFDLILSGDNHLTFTAERNGRVLVNPGSFMRTTAAQADHLPSVFLWSAETNEVERVYLPIEKGVVSREHIEVKEERDERIGAFVDRLDKEIEVGIKYEDNMKSYLAANEVDKEVQSIVWEALG